MPNTAKAYIAIVLTAGAATLLFAASHWTSANPYSFAAFLAFILFASTLKIHIPGMTGTISANFVFLLIGVAVFSFSEVVVAALTAALLQSVWRTSQRLRLVQVLFSISTLLICSAAAFFVSHGAAYGFASTSPLATILLSGSVYLSLDTALVSVVVSLVDRRSFREVFQLCIETTFPYFCFGIVVTGMVSSAITSDQAWQRSALVFPAVFLAYLYFLGRNRQGKSTQVNSVLTPDEEAELMLISSNRH